MRAKGIFRCVYADFPNALSCKWPDTDTDTVTAAATATVTTTVIVAGSDTDLPQRIRCNPAMNRTKGKRHKRRPRPLTID